WCVKSARGEVVGELLWLRDPERALEVLDQYEGVDDPEPEYVRVVADVMIGREIVPAWLYVGGPAVPGAAVVVEGCDRYAGAARNGAGPIPALSEKATPSGDSGRGSRTASLTPPPGTSIFTRRAFPATPVPAMTRNRPRQELLSGSRSRSALPTVRRMPFASRIRTGPE